MKPETAALILAARREIAQRPSAARVHTVKSTGAQMPAMVRPDGSHDKNLPGGLPPVPYRSQNNWSKGNKHVFSDGTSRECRAECWHSNKGWV